MDKSRRSANTIRHDRRGILDAVEGRGLAGRVEIGELMKLARASSPRCDDGMSSVVQGDSGLYYENALFGVFGQPSPRTHLSNNASPQKYAEMVRADRMLRLAGYEV